MQKYFSEEGTWLFIYLKTISFHYLKKKAQHEEWPEEGKEKEYIPPKEIAEIIAEKERSINDEFFRDYVKYQSAS